MSQITPFYRRLAVLIVILLSSANSFAQTAVTQSVEMADAMRANGKIYVVVVVVAIIMAVILTYLINLDRKISRLEQEES